MKCIINPQNKKNQKKQMSTFEKLFVNSTNRFSAVKNIILSQPSPDFIPLEPSEYHSRNIVNRNSSLPRQCYQQQITQTFQELLQKFNQLNKINKQANHEKQMMAMLFDKIFKIQQGKEEKLKKRFRRKKNQIQSKFECNIPNCNKIYSSATSLARHSKLKHVYAMFQPPQHTYQIPPQPNLNDFGQLEKRDETQSNIKSHSQDKNDHQDDIDDFPSEEDSYEAAQADSGSIDQEKQPS